MDYYWIFGVAFVSKYELLYIWSILHVKYDEEHEVKVRVHSM